MFNLRSESQTSGRSLVVFVGESAGTSEAEFMHEYNKLSKSVTWFLLIFLLGGVTTVAIHYAVLPYTFLEHNDKFLESIDSNLAPLSECDKMKPKKLVDDVENFDTRPTKDLVEEICPRVLFTLDNTVLSDVGQCIGALTGGLLGDLYGRRFICLRVSFPVWVFAVVVLAVPSTLATFYTLFFFLNVAGGAILLLVYVNLMEISHKKYRVFIMFIPYAYFIVLTILAVDFKIRYMKWSACQYVNIINLTMMGLAFWLIPESPRWLLNKGKKEQAFELLVEMNIETECHLVDVPDDDEPPTMWEIVKGMARHLKRRKVKLLILLSMLSVCNGFLYAVPKWRGILIEYEKWSSFRYVRITAWCLSIPFTIPVYFGFGVKYGQLFLYVSYGVSSLIMTLLGAGTIVAMVYNTFSTVFSLSCDAMLFWFVVETFPTFMRGTALSICFTMFRMADVFLASTHRYWAYKLDKNSMMIGMCVMSIFGLAVIFVPMHSNRRDLPNHKLILH